VQVSVIICLFTKIAGCVCQVSHGRPYIGLLVRITNRHHTVDKIGVQCVFKNYNIVLYLIKLLNVSVIFIEYTRSCYANIQ